MRFSIITLFPEVFEPTINSSILKRAREKKLIEFELINLRDFGQGFHKKVDDRPYGGGVGMILKPDVLAEAVKRIKNEGLEMKNKKQRKYSKLTILMSASGKTFNQSQAQKFSKFDHITLVCGHYEGIDQRFIDKYTDEEISIGDYVLTGGEIPAMVLIDSITRLIPGVLEKKEAIQNESFSPNLSFLPQSSKQVTHLPTDRHDYSLLLEYPQYTRPLDFEGQKVPSILISGNHQEIARWRKEEALKKTRKIHFKEMG